MLIPKLRMQFAEFLDANSSVAFAFSARPPVSVYGTVPGVAPRGCFSSPHARAFPPPWGRSLSARLGARTSLGPSSPRALGGAYRRPARAPAVRRPIVSARRRGIVDPLPIAYGSHPRLRGRLTLGQIAFTLETSGFRRTGIPPVFHVTHACILSPAASTGAHAPASPARGMLSYRADLSAPAASVARLAPLHCRRADTRPVSCYALLGGVAASEPTSWLSVHPHFLSHSARIRDLGRRSGLFPSRRRPLSVAA